MQHRYQPTAFARHPAAARAVRVLVAIGIAGVFAAAWGTAGPGNGWQPPLERVAVTLPAVTIVGHRDALAAGAGAPVTACERQSAETPRAAGKTA